MSGIGLIGRLDVGSALLRQRLEVLTRQVSDGRVGPGYGDIAPEARRAVDLRADIGRRDAWQGTISRALAHTEVTQKALGRMEEIATSFYQEAIRLDGTSTARIGAVAAPPARPCCLCRTASVPRMRFAAAMDTLPS